MKLKPCPFCGAGVVEEQPNMWAKICGSWVWCRKCGCMGPQDHLMKNTGDPRQSWNVRAVEDTKDAKIAQLEAEIAQLEAENKRILTEYAEAEELWRLEGR